MRFEQEKYNHWTILCILPPKKENHWSKWGICRCDCGKIYKKQYHCIKHGHSKQCVDCGNKSRRHTEDYLRLYSVYIQMKERCLKKNHKHYTDYGGRGIKICNEWLNSYKKFYEWAINTGYKKGLSIDRIDNNGDYCPENCHWATHEQQMNNKRNTLRFMWNGKLLPLGRICKETNSTYHIIYRRLKYGWNIEDAINKPVRILKVNNK